jgi:flagellar basal body-associated protein FliL
MVDINGMVDRCMDAMSSMMGGSMMGSGLLLVVLIALLVLWLVGLAAVGVLGFWAVRRLSKPHTW